MVSNLTKTVTNEFSLNRKSGGENRIMENRLIDGLDPPCNESESLHYEVKPRAFAHRTNMEIFTEANG